MKARVYILEGYQLVPKDANGSNNPYLTLTNGKEKIKDIETAKQSTSRPMFYKCYQITCKFPSETVLTISVYDYDKLKTDELIGSTKIDLENRYFNKSNSKNSLTIAEWRELKEKPIEFRTLWNP